MGNTTLDQSKPGNNSDKKVLHTPQNCSLTTRCSLVPYPGHIFDLGGVLTPLQGIHLAYSRPHKQDPPF